MYPIFISPSASVVATVYVVSVSENFETVRAAIPTPPESLVVNTHPVPPSVPFSTNTKLPFGSLSSAISAARVKLKVPPDVFSATTYIPFSEEVLWFLTSTRTVGGVADEEGTSISLNAFSSSVVVMVTVSMLLILAIVATFTDGLTSRPFATLSTYSFVATAFPSESSVTESVTIMFLNVTELVEPNSNSVLAAAALAAVTRSIIGAVVAPVPPNEIGTIPACIS